MSGADTVDFKTYPDGLEQSASGELLECNADNSLLAALTHDIETPIAIMPWDEAQQEFDGEADGSRLCLYIDQDINEAFLRAVENEIRRVCRKARYSGWLDPDATRVTYAVRSGDGIDIYYEIKAGDTLLSAIARI